MTLLMPPTISRLFPKRTGQWLKLWVPFILFAALWIDLTRQLGFVWDANEQYAYGWFVPVLALGLFARRWCTRPVAQCQPAAFWLVALAVGIALIILPIRIVYEINPDWPLFSWLMAIFVVGISLLAIFLVGGWSWIIYFVFPISFFLVAVPWPYRIEHTLTQHLMQAVVSLTVELLGWINIPALRHGNLIQIGDGVVGIDEACSGIRSFHSMLMAALFLGEFYRLRWPCRSLLVAEGLVAAFCFNVLRTLVLSWQASTAGLAAMERWHDPAGLMVFLASFGSLWALAFCLKARFAVTGEPIVSQTLQQHQQPWPIASRTFMIAVGCWYLFVLALTEGWYRAHEIKPARSFHWTIALPEINPTFQPIEMTPRTTNLLAYDFGRAGKWQQSDGSQWSLYFFRWQPRSIGAVIMSRIHRPDRCLPAAGLQQIADSGIKYFTAADLQLPFRRYTYEANGNKLYVFFCQWEDGTEKQWGLQGSNQSERLRSVLVGRRKIGNQSLELMVSGYASLAEADQAVKQRLPELIQPDNQSLPLQTRLRTTTH